MRPFIARSLETCARRIKIKLSEPGFEGSGSLRRGGCRRLAPALRLGLRAGGLAVELRQEPVESVEVVVPAGSAGPRFVEQSREPDAHAGQLSLKQLAALTAQAQLFIGVDSAPMHIAAAMQTPVVALFGPSGEIVIDYAIYDALRLLLL